MIVDREQLRSPQSTADPIGAWLDVLTTLLRLPPADRAEIRDELESHLRDRTRDLMLAGAPETDAASRAIAELGSAAQLADRYFAARKRPFLRRHAMNLTVLGLAGAAAVLSVVAIATPAAPPAPPSSPNDIEVIGRLLQGGQLVRGQYLPPAQSAGADALTGLTVQRSATEIVGEVLARGNLRPAPQVYTEGQDEALAGITLRAEFDGAPLAEVLTAIAEASKRPYIIRWASIEPGNTNDLDRRQDSTPVTLKLNAEVPLDRLLRLVNQSMDVSAADPIEFRVTDGILEIATRGYFDKRESTLVAYDLGVIKARDVASEEVVNLITSVVEADNWRNNGGDIASVYSLADRLFISAPPRMHERVRWVLQELEASRGEPVGAAGDGAVHGAGRIMTHLAAELVPPVSETPAPGQQVR